MVTDDKELARRKLARGVFDKLFGPRITIEMPHPGGRVRRQVMTPKYLATVVCGRRRFEEERSGRVLVFTRYPRQETWSWRTVGMQMEVHPRDNREYLDLDTFAMYELVSFKQGEWDRHFVYRPFYLYAISLLNQMPDEATVREELREARRQAFESSE